MSTTIFKEVFIMYNHEIKSKAKERNVKRWEVAEAYGITDGNFSRKLRRELPEAEKTKILALIEKIAERRENNG